MRATNLLAFLFIFLAFATTAQGQAAKKSLSKKMGQSVAKDPNRMNTITNEEEDTKDKPTKGESTKDGKESTKGKPAKSNLTKGEKALKIADKMKKKVENVFYKVSADKSEMTWTGYKVLGKHTGTVKVKSGSLSFADEELMGGTFEIDMSSLKCTDLEGKMAGKLEGHLKSADFFGVEKHPTAKFEITKVVSRGKTGEYKVLGNLTIKGKTQPIKFNTVVSMEKDALDATADISIDRSDYDIRYGSGSFFDGLGDKTIYDEFDLSLKLVANKTAKQNLARPSSSGVKGKKIATPSKKKAADK